MDNPNQQALEELSVYKAKKRRGKPTPRFAFNDNIVPEDLRRTRKKESENTKCPY